jgi:hypothetical protein
MFSSTSREHVISTSHTVDQIIQTILRSQFIVMWTGHQAQIGNLLVDIFFYSQEVQFLGAQRNRQPLHYRQWRPSMLLLPTLPSKFCGNKHYLMTSKFHSLRHQFCIQIIRLPFLFHHPEFHACMKHIDIAHFLCNLVESGTIETTYIQTCENLVDSFT